jgi:hypothetical protein
MISLPLKSAARLIFKLKLLLGKHDTSWRYQNMRQCFISLWPLILCQCKCQDMLNSEFLFSFIECINNKQEVDINIMYVYFTTCQITNHIVIDTLINVINMYPNIYIYYEFSLLHIFSLVLQPWMSAYIRKTDGVYISVPKND